jgi:hypothetical protein
MLREEMKTSPVVAPLFISDLSKYIVQYYCSTRAGGIWVHKVCLHLGLDGFPRSIGDALSHEFNRPLSDSFHRFITLDHLPKREG